MRVYITGIDGMLGSAIADIHRKRGDSVFGCDAGQYPSAQAFDRIDIRRFDMLRDSMQHAQPSVVYHCAAMLGVQNTEEYPEVCRQINELGTANAVRAAFEAGAETFVFLSSSEVYGNGFDFKPFAENSPLLGENVYADGKKKGEQIALGYASRMKVVIARMFNCYGVGQVAQFFIPKVIMLCGDDRKVPIYGSPENKRSYLFGHDAATHLVNLAENAPNREIVNVGHPMPYTLGETFLMIKEMMSSKSEAAVRMRASGDYDDRKVSRDVPNRLGVFDKLKEYSKHTPMEFPIALRFMIHASATIRLDWTYRRELL